MVTTTCYTPDGQVDSGMADGESLYISFASGYTTLVHLLHFKMELYSMIHFAMEDTVAGNFSASTPLYQNVKKTIAKNLFLVKL